MKANARFYLVRAQDADAIANAAISPANRRYWEAVADDYRRQAREAIRLHGDKSSDDQADQSP